ncbi:hypothetical protein [Cohnella yongneupensis]|uniref:CDP-Glycerol:Poly(Glycerophosphate) glycerophosphotransferase n=1 Tax=Cohnella yongneupensis TaxID=425006 RepID=A0ABW0QXE6_9BACL
MRKHQQQQLLDLLHTLEEAHDELARQTAHNTIVSLLADCQEFALKIGGFIEQIEGEGTRTVALLEEYCDLLYKASMEFEPMNSVAQLRRQLIVITNSAQDELKSNKLEIAFFPYKASMFDALESIWLAAKDDPRCDVYVVPIPYYDKLPNGQLGQMHYEGDQYPAHIPITNWQEYDVEARRPDIIYIHNPYDNANLATSVHPMYYSKRLRELTDQLVYVPYFVSNGDVSEGSCGLPGCIYAHKVFVQSEKVRQTYIRVYKKLAEQHRFGELFGQPESKFVALGSPKFDKVVNSRREDYTLPEQWAELMVRPDGTRKKVILYNTAIGSLLSGNDAVLHKLKYVFDVFREREDVLLWWRPHPLNGTVYSSMRPQLLADYEAIVAEYRRSGFGIYDDSADSHRAIAMSDAYFGDGGSLLALYSLTGKPTMTQNVKIKERESYNKFAFSHATDDGGYWWLSLQFGDSLMRLDKQTKKMDFISLIPDERYCGWTLYSDSILCGQKLFLAPAAANEIASYDTVTGEWEKIPFELNVPASDNLYFPVYKFSGIKRHKQWLFIIPSTYPAIIRYNLETGELDYVTDWVIPLEKYKRDPVGMWFSDCLQEGASLLLSACNASAVVIFDMEKCVSTVRPIEGTNIGFGGICFDGEQYWLTPRKNGSITRWDRKRNKFEELTAFPEGYVGGGFPFGHPIYVNGSICLFPVQANMAIKIDAGDKKMASFDTIPVSAAPFAIARMVGDKLVAVSARENRLFELDVPEALQLEHEIALSDEREANRQGLFGSYNQESAATGADEFCDYLLERNELDSIDYRLRNQMVGNIANPDGHAGLAIYERSMQALLRTVNA